MKRHRFLREPLDEYEDAISYYEMLRQGLGVSSASTSRRPSSSPELGALVDDTPAELGIRRRLPRVSQPGCRGRARREGG